MNPFFKTSLQSTLAALSLTVGCATTPPAELVAAREAYRTARADALEAPTELHNAEVALEDAEVAFRKDASSPVVKDRAYVAQRRAELASSRSATVTSRAEREIYNAKIREMGRSAIGDLQAAKGDLTDAQRQARAARNDVNGLKTELNDSENNARNLQTELGDEKDARRAAEMKLTSTLKAMENLSVREEERGLVITLSGAVLFVSGESSLLPAARAALDNVAAALIETPGRTIIVEGHTDSQGTHRNNMALSQRRGDSVRFYLISQGLSGSAISAVGLGPDRPVTENKTPEGRANNRRVEIILAPAPL